MFYMSTPQDRRRERGRRARLCVCLGACDELIGLALGEVRDAREELLEKHPIGARQVLDEAADGVTQRGERLGVNLPPGVGRRPAPRGVFLSAGRG